MRKSIRVPGVDLQGGRCRVANGKWYAPRRRALVAGRVSSFKGKEPVPAPGLPPEYPHYLKPIKVNTRDTHAVLMGYLDREAPKVRRFLYSTWTAQEEALKYQEIANAMSGRILTEQGMQQLTEQWLAEFQESYARLVNEELAPAWVRAIEAGGALLEDGINGFREGFQFTPTGVRIDAWVKERGAQWVTAASDTQVAALRNLLRYYTTTRPVSAAELAQMIRPIVGLTEGQADAVRAYREKLLAGKVAAQQAKLGRVLTEDEVRALANKVERQVQNYAARLHRIRAQRIADTELSFAHNRGQLEAMYQAREEGWFGDHQVTKVWATAEDERVCRFCGPLDGKVLFLDGEWTGQSKKEPRVPAPPLHPWCRCTLDYYLVPPEKAGGIPQQFTLDTEVFASKVDRLFMEATAGELHNRAA